MRIFPSASIMTSWRERVSKALLRAVSSNPVVCRRVVRSHQTHLPPTKNATRRLHRRTQPAVWNSIQPRIDHCRNSRYSRCQSHRLVRTQSILATMAKPRRSVLDTRSRCGLKFRQLQYSTVRERSGCDRSYLLLCWKSD